MNNIIILLFGIVCLCNAAHRGAVTTEKVPKGFDLLPPHRRSITDNGEISVVIALKQRNLDKLEATFWAVSDPHNRAYGKHLTFDGMVDLIAPSQDSLDTVINWMTENGIEKEKIVLRSSKDFLNVGMTVAQAESLFKAPQTPLVHTKTGKVSVHMASGYELPEYVNSLIDFVSDLNEIKNAPRVREFIPSAESHVSVRNEQVPRASNAPNLVSVYTLSNGIIFTGVFLYCIDGSVPAVYYTNGAPVLSCGGTTLSSVSVTLTDTVHSSSLGSYNLSYSSCSLCRRNASCQVTINDQNGMFCRLQRINGIPNYLPFTITLANIWSDGSQSSSSTSGILSCGDEVVPEVIKRTYSIPDGTEVTQTGNSQAVAEFTESFLLSDAIAYFKLFNLPDMSDLIEVVNPINTDPEDPGSGEGILDIIAIMGTARNCKTYYWTEANSGYSPFLTYIQDVLNTVDAPLVHSISWAFPETLSGGGDINVRTNVEFIKAGVRGITLLTSSGDYGVQPSIDPDYPPYWPIFPTSSPYVTSVGATQFAPASTDPSCYSGSGPDLTYTCKVTEIACSSQTGALITSGSGFSNLFDTPSYQKDVVSVYLSNVPSAQKSYFNLSGRGYPDISAVGHNIEVVWNGTVSNFDGTSASSPFCAGMVTLLNDIRLSQNKPPLGFINPLLYSLNSSYFFDVTVGNNKCVPGQCTDYGFEASKGWDAVTGLGTPIFSNLAEYVRNLGDYDPLPDSAASSVGFSFLFVVMIGWIF